MKVRREDNGEITLELVQSKSIEDGGCWIWQYGSAHGAPYMSVNRKAVAVKRWIAKNVLGKEIRGRIATSSCMNKMCVCPDHVIVVTRQKLQQMWSDHIQYAANPIRRQKLVDAARRRYGHDEELIQRILDDDRTQRQIAESVGKSQDYVSKVKRGHYHKTPANPFFGLMR